MDGTPHLLTDVKFDVLRKGYDPEQVDNFLEQISAKVAQLQDMVRQATTRADEAEAKIAEAKRAQGVAEAQADKLKADLVKAGERPKVDPEEEAQQASKILLMAQKTADATIDDANRSAQSAVTDARAKAAGLVAEAEAEVERLQSEAQRQIDELVAQRRGEVMAEVGGLEVTRDEVQADVDALHAHLAEQRSRLRNGVEALTHMLDDPAAFRVEEPPALRTSGSSVVEPEAAVEAEPSPSTTSEAGGAMGRDEDGAASVPSTDEVESEPLETAAEMIVTDREADAADGTDDGTDDGSGVAEGPGVEAEDQVAAVPTPSPDAADEFPPVKVPELLADEGIVSGSGDAGPPEGGGLFQAGAEGGPPTELFTAFDDDDGGERSDPLGVLDDDADAAMRAFFEADFAEDDEPKKPRWRR